MSLLLLRPHALVSVLRWTGARVSQPQRAALRALQAPPPSVGHGWFTHTASRRPPRQTAGKVASNRKQATPLRSWLTRSAAAAWQPLAGLSLLTVMTTVAVPTSDMQQWVLGGALLAVAWLNVRSPRRADDRTRALWLMGLSLVLAGRYAWWRITQTLHFNGPVEAVAGVLLLAAEGYYWLVLLLSHVQLAWPLRRSRTPMHAAAGEPPQVDVFIPTYNEPLHVVRPTVLAAQNIDWPAHRLRIHLLDDGRRDEFAAFARDAGVNYIRRTDNRHAKAGNINHALDQTSGEFVAIFDCDHIPVRDFLRATMGWLVGHPACAMVQTPHHLFSQDPVERNTRLQRGIPNEGSLFYGAIQSGNDLWNASFFCGSCAVLRRSSLQAIGGIAVETVTEDAHTALKLHRLGYTTAYLPRILAAGLATESLAGHIGQRIRWARGMAQIFRLDNPLRGPGLSPMQRLCYFNAMLHFFNGLPRLILLSSPIAYLAFGLQLLDASMPTLVAYLLPHLLMGKIVESRVHGPFRASSWGAIYETLLAWYIMRPTLLALVAPKLGRFNVTAKGGRIDREYFDWRVAAPYAVLIAASLIAVLLGANHLVQGAGPDRTATALNMGWAALNLLVLGVALRVATETRQVRLTPRVRLSTPVPARLHVQGTSPVRVSLMDFSLQGLGLKTTVLHPFTRGQACQIHLHDGQAWHAFPATLSRVNGTSLGLRLDGLDLPAQRHLMKCTFSRADLWRRQSAHRHHDRPWWEFWQLLRTGVNGYVQGLVPGLRELGHGLRQWWRERGAR